MSLAAGDRWSAVCASLEPVAAGSVWEWAETHRVLAPRGSAEPGRWSSARTPYVRGILDALSVGSAVRRVVLMKGAQVGASEMGLCWLGYVMHVAPGPMMIVQPTVDLAMRFSRQRVAGLIEHTDVVRVRTAPPRSRDGENSVLHKRIAGVDLVLTGANSPVGLRSMPVRYLFLDEVDAYPPTAGAEGDPIALAEARTRTYGGSARLYLASTPTVAGISRIEREYLASDQRRYFVPCPHCGHMQVLEWGRMRWVIGSPETAQYSCASCERLIDERHKTEMLAAGEWRATATGAPGVAGFHLSSLYSPYGWYGWADAARDFEACRGDEEAMRAWHNSVLGVAYAAASDAVAWAEIAARRGSWPRGTVPRGGAMLTAGADVQRDRVEVAVWAWGRDRSCWLVEHEIIGGGPTEDATWRDLSALLVREWPREDGGVLRLRRIAVDSGYQSSSVYRWVQSAGQRLAMAVRGAARASAGPPVIGPRQIAPRTRGVARSVQSAALYVVQTAVWKSELMSGLRAGAVRLPDWADDEYLRQLTAEREDVVRGRRGYARREWRMVYPRNEALDCWVYARAAAWVCGMDRWSPARWSEVEAEEARFSTAAIEAARSAGGIAAVPAGGVAVSSGWLGGLRSGWLSRQ